MNRHFIVFFICRDEKNKKHNGWSSIMTSKFINAAKFDEEIKKDYPEISSLTITGWQEVSKEEALFFTN